MRRESGSKSHAQSRERETEEFCSHNLQNLAALIGLGGVENGRSTSLCRNLTAQSSVCWVPCSYIPSLVMYAGWRDQDHQQPLLSSSRTWTSTSVYCSSPKEDWSSVAALSQMLACPASSLAWAHGLDHPSAARCYLDVASALVYRWRHGMLGEVLLHLPIMAVVPTSFGAACPATHIYHWSLGWPLAFTSARRWHVRLHCQIDGYASKK